MRSDLSPAQQAVQGIHAACEWMLKYPEYGHETVVLVSVRDPLDLHALGGRAAVIGAKVAEFHDEDVTEEFSITAVASGDPKACVLFRSLPLALSGEGVRR